jgi:phosphoglycerate kinase
MPPATLHDIPIQGKRLCIRVDCHVPLTTDHHIVDDTRIRAALPTLVYALQHGARVVLASHLWRSQRARWIGA